MIAATLREVDESVTLQFDRAVNASTGATFDALVKPTLLQKWLADAEFDPSVGGVVHLVWPGSGEMNGVVQLYDSPTLVAYTWDEENGSSLVRWEIAPIDDASCTLRLIHSGTKKEDASGFGAGWQSHLEALDAVLAGTSSNAEQRNERYEELHREYVKAVAAL
jgi:uncharacterized protein YndB with AHSA1/START domain